MGTPIWRGSIALVEQPNSPQYTYGEKVTQVRIFRGPWTTCLSSAPFRGALGAAVLGGVGVIGYRVAETTVNKERGGIGTLTIKYEVNGDPGGATLPADEISCDLEKFERSLREHPRYASLTESLKTDIDTLLSTAEDNSSHANAKIRVVASALANELYLKNKRQFTHFLLYPPSLKIIRYYWSLPPDLVGGAFRQSPPTEHVPVTMMDVPIQWIREGDRWSYNGTHYQVTRSWMGAIEWDTQIYP